MTAKRYYPKADNVDQLGPEPKELKSIGVVYMNANRVMTYYSYEDSELSKSKDARYMAINQDELSDRYVKRLDDYSNDSKLGQEIIQSIFRECHPHVHSLPGASVMAVRVETDLFLKHMVGATKLHGNENLHLLKEFLSKSSNAYDFSIVDGLWNDMEPWSTGAAYLLAYVDYWHGIGKTRAIIERTPIICRCCRCTPVSSDNNNVNNNLVHANTGYMNTYPTVVRPPSRQVTTSRVITPIANSSLPSSIINMDMSDNNNNNASEVMRLPIPNRAPTPRAVVVMDSGNRANTPLYPSILQLVIPSNMLNSIRIEGGKEIFKGSLESIIKFINATCIRSSTGNADTTTQLYKMYNKWDRCIIISSDEFTRYIRAIRKVIGSEWRYRKT